MISKKEHDAALRRVLRRLGLGMCGVFMMAAAFYMAFGIGRCGALLALAAIGSFGYALGGSEEDGDAI